LRVRGGTLWRDGEYLLADVTACFSGSTSRGTARRLLETLDEDEAVSGRCRVCDLGLGGGIDDDRAVFRGGAIGRA